jgi:hypothetical protein
MTHEDTELGDFDASDLDPPMVVEILTAGLREEGPGGPSGADPQVAQWVIYDRGSSSVYVVRKMDWAEVNAELKVLLEPYPPGHMWTQRLCVMFCGSEPLKRKRLPRRVSKWRQQPSLRRHVVDWKTKGR